MNEAMIEARGLSKSFEIGGGFLKAPRHLHAVDAVDLTVARGETFAIVGESGCGKSTLARLLMRLHEPSDGSVRVAGHEIARISGQELRALRRDVQFIFQDPFSSLNPRLTVARLVGEPLEAHRPELDSAARRAEVARLLAQVGLRPEHMDRYPHEFSGGQRQRIGIARALASGPKLLIGDEPVSALDVSVQAQVVNLLADLRDELGLTLVVIAHDLAVIRQMSDRVAVMYLGRIVESGPTDAIFTRPRHPYTRALLAAIPGPEGGGQGASLTGETPSPMDPPSGCHFRTRCPHAAEICAGSRPPTETSDSGTSIACFRWREIAEGGDDMPPPPARSAGAERRFHLYRQALAAKDKTDKNQQEGQQP
ncbi:peptide/nickel transport system ATP-binding protein/oligopeptide transport system ATP-binding protein [Paracoccus isoporae]|uniref:Peptide/nickel transport system ATP-binding protein/oligopeptide transport system ATP-binding protein n=1 Tax=Paracoccus isoporae TaxID=591205 RepID=A0A1G6ZKW2_9RHOB|nr:oligopeptide/dipeptide ABC transporter ATP-binding protein [Paracoccus isoporae]SDE02196.1 peptide/nickel transport system ATP-binding protein/oligopeptide transport system ATP-binding protein [Paracoccus isoporae]